MTIDCRIVYAISTAHASRSQACSHAAAAWEDERMRGTAIPLALLLIAAAAVAGDAAAHDARNHADAEGFL